MIRALNHNIPISDNDFDKIYPLEIQQLSDKHWTPIFIAKRAASFLVTKPGTKVLDIGSGVGKFCVVGAQTSSGVFFGVEQRKHLVNISEEIIKKFNLPNVTIIHSNILKIDFTQFDAFYFYNSFYENIEKSAIIDNTLHLSYKKYLDYKNYLTAQLEKVPIGTRLVTYSGYTAEVPPCFTLVKTELNFDLKFWVKEKQSTVIPAYF